jgi:hypothetical protein
MRPPTGPAERGPSAGKTRHRGRTLTVHLLRSAGATAALTTFYFLAPLDRLGTGTVALLLVGLIAFAWLVTWQVWAISRSPFPRLRGLEALLTTVPLFLVLFSTTYYLMAREQPGSFSEPLTRLDAMYFTVTVFATVGFGDIVPTNATGRAVTTGQMVADIIVVGFVAKVLFGAVRAGLRRRESEDASEPPDEFDP